MFGGLPRLPNNGGGANRLGISKENFRLESSVENETEITPLYNYVLMMYARTNIVIHENLGTLPLSKETRGCLITTRFSTRPLLV